MFRNTLRLECKKAICNKFFLMVILIGCAITFFTLIPSVQIYHRDLANEARFGLTMSPVAESIFGYWVGGDVMSAGSAQYFFLFPLLLAIPFGWSYCAERRSGYIKNMVIRAGRTQYHLSKYIALFLSGGLAMVIPLIFNFMVTAMFIPTILPDICYATSFGVVSKSLFSMLFYTHPLLYLLAYLAVDFVFCGLIACLCFAVSSFIKNRIVVVLLPFFILLGFHYFCASFIYTSSSVIYTELSPMYFLRPCPAAYDTNWIVVAAEGAVLFIVTFLATVVRGRRHEIY